MAETPPKKCGTCYWFIVKPDEIAVAQHAPPISECQPGKPHCLGGQVRGACEKWQERAQLGYEMPWGDGPMVESTFGCPLWKAGGPRPKGATLSPAHYYSKSGGFNKLPMWKRNKAMAWIAAGLAAIFAATRGGR